MMNFCASCGKPPTPYTAFCPHCGASLTGNRSQQKLNTPVRWLPHQATSPKMPDADRKGRKRAGLVQVRGGPLSSVGNRGY
jgi:hypothetical protein